MPFSTEILAYIPGAKEILLNGLDYLFMGPTVDFQVVLYTAATRNQDSECICAYIQSIGCDTISVKSSRVVNIAKI